MKHGSRWGGYGRTWYFVARVKIGTKRVDSIVEAIPFLIGCALRFGELVAEFLDDFFETHDCAI